MLNIVFSPKANVIADFFMIPVFHKIKNFFIDENNLSSHTGRLISTSNKAILEIILGINWDYHRVKLITVGRNKP